MERVLWYLFAGTRGGETRAKIIQLLDEQPRNPNQLANDVGLDYNTVKYHMEKLEEHTIVEREQEGYGALYFLTDQFENHREDFLNILDTADVLGEESETLQREEVGP